jgi:hypothetical protein
MVEIQAADGMARRFERGRDVCGTEREKIIEISAVSTDRISWDNN